MLSGRTIFVVEDEMLVLLNLKDMLADLGCERVIAAASVDQALAMLGAQQVIDAGMLDLNLNGERSYPVADALVRRGVPFIFASGYGASGLPEAYRGCPLLTKPYGQDALAKMLTLVLADRPQRMAEASETGRDRVAAPDKESGG